MKDAPELELTVTVVNLNTGNDGLLKACRELMEYMVLVKRIREYGEILRGN